MNYPNDPHEWRLIKVYETDFRPSLLDMAQTITRLGLWDWVIVCVKCNQLRSKVLKIGTNDLSKY